MAIQYAYAADITKSERDDNGDLIVYGKATGPDLDLDEQICDAEWLKTAMPAWMEWGNIREMHQPIAAGVGIELEQQGDDWFVKSKCVDPNTAKKIEDGVLKGYSVGIKDPKVIKDAAAPGGRINGGSIVEVSYVDRPCNPTAKMAIAKAAGATTALQPVEADAAETVSVTIKVAGTEFKPSDLAKLINRGRNASKAADTDEPIENSADEPANDVELAATEVAATDSDVEATDTTQKSAADLRDAIRAIGHARDAAEATERIERRIKALGCDDVVPANWKAAVANLAKAETQLHDPAELATIRSGLIGLIHVELGELENGEPEIWDIEGLLCSLRMFLNWWDDEAWGGKTESPRETPKPGGTDVAPDIDATDADEAVDADTTKTTETEGAEKDPKAEDDTTSGSAKSAEPDKDLLTELVKSAVADATKPLIEKAAEERKALEAELKTVKDDLAKALALPEPGGPVLTRTAQAAAKSATHSETETEIARLLSQADQMDQVDKYAAKGYRDRAQVLRKALDA